MAGTAIPTTMVELGGAALLRLAAALSPVFPTGGFSFSQGLERAVHDGLVRDRQGLQEWLEALLARGSAWNDAVLFAAAWRGEEKAAELGAALAGSRERFAETTLQGGAFATAAKAWNAEAEEAAEPLPYPVAVGAFARRQDAPLEAALALFLQAWTSNLVQAALRLLPIGHTGGVRTLAALEPVILATAARAKNSTLDDLGSSAFLSEIASLRHETQYSRIFRS
ncbi:MAG TPA: urease accessory protein UreF [Mesorhizobium sp.]|jgi:urease accessory protein|nr:urease accessory protein UreF [Mesorhizobium sp.]